MKLALVHFKLHAHSTFPLSVGSPAARHQRVLKEVCVDNTRCHLQMDRRQIVQVDLLDMDWLFSWNR